MDRQHTHRRVAAILLTLALVLAACGGDDSATDGAGQGTDPAPDAGDEEALAEAIRIDASVDARIGNATDYSGVTDPAPVNAGDNIRTDTTGFAEIAYFDGSLTRLDINTDFTVLELNNAPGNSTIRTQMGIGRTWHRVQTLTGNDTYQVETSVATAVVRGTAFIIECTPTACTFTVLEGTIELTLPDGTTTELNTNQTITIEANGQPLEPNTITANPLDDPWYARNNQLDTQQGNNNLNPTTPDDDPTGNDPAAGGAGRYIVAVSVTGHPFLGDFDFNGAITLEGACDGVNECEMINLTAMDGPEGGIQYSFTDLPLEPGGDGYTGRSTNDGALGCGTGDEIQFAIGPSGLKGSWERCRFAAAGNELETVFTFEPGTWTPPVPVDCVMNGTATVGADVTRFIDEPVSRGTYIGPSGSGYSFTYGAFGDALGLSVSPDDVFFGPGLPGTSVNDGGTYDFDPDGLGATVVDERPGQLDSPLVGIDVVIECTPAG